MVQTAVTKVQDTDLNVKFIVSDQDPVHRSMFKSLGVTKERPSFSVDNHEVHVFSYSPHLLKSLRNTLRKHEIRIGSDIVS